jgi:ferrous iron transport protein A
MLYFAAFGGCRPPVTKRKRKQRLRPIDKDFRLQHTEAMLQLSGNKDFSPAPFATLLDLRRGDAAILEGIDLPSDEARRLMELGFLPGTRITAGYAAPGGDPRVFQVDGSEIALRRETARRMKVRPAASSKTDSSKTRGTPRIP